MIFILQCLRQRFRYDSVHFRDCLRSGQCIIAPFDNLHGQPCFQLDTLTKNFKIKGE